MDVYIKNWYIFHFNIVFLMHLLSVIDEMVFLKLIMAYSHRFIMSILYTKDKLMCSFNSFEVD